MCKVENTVLEHISKDTGGNDIYDRAPSRENHNWFAVYTKSRHEKKADRALRKKNVESFLPAREVISRWKDRKKKVLMPFFPGYLFVNIDLRDRYTVLNTSGVVKILGNNGGPVPIPAEEIEAVRKLMGAGLKCAPYPYDIEGKEVELIRGPLNGARGKVLRVKGAYNLILSVHLIKRSVSVEVDLDDISFI